MGVFRIPGLHCRKRFSQCETVFSQFVIQSVYFDCGFTPGVGQLFPFACVQLLWLLCGQIQSAVGDGLQYRQHGIVKFGLLSTLEAEEVLDRIKCALEHVSQLNTRSSMLEDLLRIGMYENTIAEAR